MSGFEWGLRQYFFVGILEGLGGVIVPVVSWSLASQGADNMSGGSLGRGSWGMFVIIHRFVVWIIGLREYYL